MSEVAVRRERMKCNRVISILPLALSLTLLCPAQSQMSANPDDQESTHNSASKGHDDDRPVSTEELRKAVLWHDPGQISALDLLDGQGGKEGMPVAPFKFEAEDKHGTNPKFDARDAKGTKWRVKLGDEAQPEVTASRLLWAVGYFVNDDYLIESVHVDGLHLTRGEKLVKDGEIEN